MKEEWAYKKLKDVAKYYNGLTYKPSDVKKDGILVLRSSNIQDYQLSLYDQIRVSLNVDEKLKVHKGDLIMCSRNGSKSLIGKVALIPDEIKDLTFGTFMMIFKSEYNPFLYYFFLSDNFKKQIWKGEANMINQITRYMLDDVSLPVPPLPEQQRIVNYLDAQFAKIDQLKANAEKQLQAAKDLFQKALKELMTPKKGWEEKKLGEMCSICGEYGLNESATNYNGIRYIRITDITDDGDLNDEKVSATNGNKKNQEKLEVGDILFARTGATVGKTLVYRKDFGECVFAGYLIRYRTNPDIILPKYLFYFTHSSDYYEWVKINQAAAAQPNISAQKYNGLVIAFPKDTKIQQQIADKLDALSAKVKALQSNYTETITLCNDIKQSLLRKIFE